MGGGGGGRRAIISSKAEAPVSARLEVPGILGRQQGKIGGQAIPEELTVRINSPKNNETVSKKITVEVEVRGGRGKLDALVQLDGTSIGKITKKGVSKISYNTARKTNGTYELKAIASDATNKKETEPIHIIIENRIH